MMGGTGWFEKRQPEPVVEDKPAGELIDPRFDENAKIVQWRTEQLADAGFPIKIAVKIAQNRELDYHAAIAVLRRCEGDAELAYRIVR